MCRSEGPYSHDIALLRLRTKGDGCGVRYTRYGYTYYKCTTLLRFHEQDGGTHLPP